MKESQSGGGGEPMVIGLTLQLQKFSVGKPLNDEDIKADTILGHYDSLTIRRIYRWLEFSPRVDWDSNQQPPNLKKAEMLATHYPIKLLFPAWGEPGDPVGFSYEAWKHHETLLEQNPCMTVVLLTLTDAYKELVGEDQLNSFLGLLQESCRPELLAEVNCCVLPSLGYSDLCVLMAGVNWEPALRLVERLHSLTIKDEKMPGIPVLSTDYMMPVCHTRKGGKPEEKFSDGYFTGIDLAVRVSLRPGVTTRQLASHLDGVEAYRTSGGTDCLLWAKDGQAYKMMDVLMADKERNFVVDMASALQLRLEPEEKENSPCWDRSEQSPDIQSFQQSIDAFKAAIEAYETQAIAKGRHLRQVNSLRELAAIVQNICLQPHAGALRSLLRDLMINFSQCVEKCAGYLERENGPDPDEMEEHIGLFSGVVSSFLEDLSRSDCFYMEREKYNHTSVSSATGLLIAYNRWLNEFTDAVRNATQKESRCDYAFLVTCGGRDQTQTLDAFYFLEPEVEGMARDQLYEQLPLVTQMSEMSLFDFSGTILRTVHECMHYAGERKRRERIKYLLDFVITLLADQMADTLLEFDDLYLCNTLGVLETLAEHLSLDKKGELQDKLRTACLQALNGLAQAIHDQLWICFPDEVFADWNEWDYVSRNVQAWAYNVLFKAFSGHEISATEDGTPKLRKNGLAACMCKATMEARVAYFTDCDRLCREYKITTVIFDFGAKRLDLLRERDSRSYYTKDIALEHHVQMVLSRMLLSETPSGMPTGEDGTVVDEWNHAFPYFRLAHTNVYTVLQGATDVFSEAFADMTACVILEADLEDYLLMHVYEDWNVDSALAIEMNYIYRIPAVLRLCYSSGLEDGQQRLTDAAQNRVKTAVAQLEAHGMPQGRVNADALCLRINELLGLFCQNARVGKPLLHYLEMCRDYYSRQAVRKDLQKFSDSFKKLRLWDMNPRAKNVHERLVEMYKTLLKE